LTGVDSALSRVAKSSCDFQQIPGNLNSSFKRHDFIKVPKHFRLNVKFDLTEVGTSHLHLSLHDRTGKSIPAKPVDGLNKGQVIIRGARSRVTSPPDPQPQRVRSSSGPRLQLEGGNFQLGGGHDGAVLRGQTHRFDR
jgi:hypothetical protein